MVLSLCRPFIITRKIVNKFQPKWNGLFFITHTVTNRACKLFDKDGLQIASINEKFLKRFYT